MQCANHSLPAGKEPAEMFPLFICCPPTSDRPIHPEQKPWETSRGHAGLCQRQPLRGHADRLLLPSCHQDGGPSKGHLFCKSLAGLRLDLSGFLYSPSMWTTHLQYKCPGATITKYHKLSGLKQQELTPSHFGRRRVQDPGAALLL